MRFVRLVVVLLLVGGLGLLGFLAYAWKPAIAAIDPPAPAGFDPALVRTRRRPRRRSATASSATPRRAARSSPADWRCRPPSARSTPPTSRPTRRPASAAGAKRPSRAPCARASTARAATSIPAFPYDHYTLVTDEDNRALYAYLMTREPVSAPTPPANELPFPLNIRCRSPAGSSCSSAKAATQPDAGADDGVEPGRLSRGGLGPLRRLPHAAQRARRREAATRTAPAARPRAGRPMP